MDDDDFDMEELSDIITLTNEDGEDADYRFLDLIEYDGNDYVVLLPCDDEDEIGEVIIVAVEEGEDPDMEVYIGIEDQTLLDELFAIFKEKFKDEFSFVD